ncbi:hypothetical protein JZ751_027158 [Albula glossodonta]|uniref:Uncharacterized protein n=1 Tax=Albula glossodonta TaxID=121402 RepID=A0A8T2MLF0_9TELE|nr:hypothetical protein JZ751_014011 [Albula glossodonta]KAG9338080.1 hypothetical protein JZ751_027158 [Albula glossodonta]
MDNFILTDPEMNIMRPTYNSLHDPHLFNYFHRKDMQEQLKKNGYITGEKQVKCSLKEYKTHHRYLEHIKLHADRSTGQAQRARMREFLEQQQKGLISKDLTLADIREELLEEGAARLYHIILKNQELQRKRKGGSEEFSVEALLSWKLEERARLQRIEREVRHEWNREQQLREAREKRERQRLALMERKNTLQQMKLIEEVKKSEESALKELTKKKEGTELSKEVDEHHDFVILEPISKHPRCVMVV